MAKQKHKNSNALEEEEVEEDDKGEMTDLNTICSESTFETENLEVLGGGGRLTPEGESSRLLPSEKGWVELDGCHTVTCTLTVSLAVPALPSGEYLMRVFLRTLLPLLHKFMWRSPEWFKEIMLEKMLVDLNFPG